MKVAFDEEVSPEKVHTFQQSLDKLRWLENIMDIFTLSTNTALCATTDKLVRQPKHMTIGGVAKQKFYKTAHKAGLLRLKEKEENSSGNTDVMKSRSLSRPAFRPSLLDGEIDHVSPVRKFILFSRLLM
ncbi:unnamed protein product [Soboliphyme baturini]|uniref:Gag-pol polyprotein n=1 Tax=Soboliphyme baturini TaxID=241478 RepID=A0A183I942_9BILA|nr:unnamed protein product [Soboliphyme baturini]